MWSRRSAFPKMLNYSFTLKNPQTARLSSVFCCFFISTWNHNDNFLLKTSFFPTTSALPNVIVTTFETFLSLVFLVSTATHFYFRWEMFYYRLFFLTSCCLIFPRMFIVLCVCSIACLTKAWYKSFICAANLHLKQLTTEIPNWIHPPLKVVPKQMDYFFLFVKNYSDQLFKPFLNMKLNIFELFLKVLSELRAQGKYRQQTDSYSEV